MGRTTHKYENERNVHAIRRRINVRVLQIYERHTTSSLKVMKSLYEEMLLDFFRDIKFQFFFSIHVLFI